MLLKEAFFPAGAQSVTVATGAEFTQKPLQLSEYALLWQSLRWTASPK
jgi:hypothetical protein